MKWTKDRMKYEIESLHNPYGKNPRADSFNYRYSVGFEQFRSTILKELRKYD